MDDKDWELILVVSKMKIFLWLWSNFGKAIEVESQIRVGLKRVPGKDIGESKEVDCMRKERNGVVDKNKLLSRGIFQWDY